MEAPQDKQGKSGTDIGGGQTGRALRAQGAVSP